ncbi:protein of unknown function [Methylococcus capsulatus]|uniref:Uncharacterized protein n=1 Tax=Methylococcus capsulatus TaxID=414 RepID=A0AA35V249_METCP|nr:protein of unknown function [Methylococcus capsulatus]
MPAPCCAEARRGLYASLPGCHVVTCLPPVQPHEGGRGIDHHGEENPFFERHRRRVIVYQYDAGESGGYDDGVIEHRRT